MQTKFHLLNLLRPAATGDRGAHPAAAGERVGDLRQREEPGGEARGNRAGGAEEAAAPSAKQVAAAEVHLEPGEVRPGPERRGQVGADRDPEAAVATFELEGKDHRGRRAARVPMQ